MRSWTVLAVAGGLGFTPAAGAFEYPLQFSPCCNVSGRHVAGYSFVGSTVFGDCTYVTYSGCSGRDCHGTYTSHYQGCTWDLFGNLLGITAGEPIAPPPISTTGGLIVYGQNTSGGSTGVDTAHGNLPFVNTISAQYTWVAPPAVVFLTADKPQTIPLTLQNIGDLPLAVTNVTAIVELGQLSFKSTRCKLAAVAVGKSCKLVMTYNPTKIPHGDDPYTAYDQVSVGLVSNSGLAPTTAATVETPIPPGG
jgi:hypothetical protein